MNSQALRTCFWGNTLSPCLLRCTPTIRRRPSARCSTLATHSPAEHAAPSAGALAHVEALLDRAWLLKRPDTQLQHIRGATSAYPSGSCGGSGADTLGPTVGPGFWVVRDDLLHPVAGGNKLRKMDALLPQLKNAGATDIVRQFVVDTRTELHQERTDKNMELRFTLCTTKPRSEVTCGGLQSAHTAAVAALCTEVGLRAHLLVRGERPATPTGLHLYARMYGRVSYVPRSEYADREAMFEAHAARVQEEGGKDARVAVIREGGADPAALLGMLRLAHFLAQESQLGRQLPSNILVDCGTGVSATGLALAAVLLELPWRVTGIMVAAPLEYYQKQAETLAAAFMEQFNVGMRTDVSPGPDADSPVPLAVPTWADRLPLQWVQRSSPRKFGKILAGEISECAQVAREYGILLDPMWTLASWQMAHLLAASQRKAHESVLGDGCASRGPGNERVVILMTGGGLGLHGLAQRWPDDF